MVRLWLFPPIVALHIWPERVQTPAFSDAIAGRGEKGFLTLFCLRHI
jgi:hypothetical protein